MANGAYNGYQHALLDMEELTKESFANFCDDVFYHLKHLGYEDTEQLNKAKQDERERIVLLMNDIITEQEKLVDPQNRDAAYNEYLENVTVYNNNVRKAYEEELERYNLIMSYVQEFEGTVDYIFKDFKEPKLLTTEVLGKEEWYQSQSVGSRHSLAFYEQQLEKLDGDSITQQKVESYENVKKKFLAKG